jgi:hypothetical protein
MKNNLLLFRYFTQNIIINVIISIINVNNKITVHT